MGYWLSVQHDKPMLFVRGPVRQAMVNLVLASTPQQRQEIFRAGAGDLSRREYSKFPRQGYEEDRNQMLEPQNRTQYPSKCMFWCVIALGALEQGLTSQFVNYILFDTKATAAAATYACVPASSQSCPAGEWLAGHIGKE